MTLLGMSWEALLRLRTKLKLTQVALAELLGVNPRTIMRWENDQVEIPVERVFELRRLARSKGVAA